MGQYATLYRIAQTDFLKIKDNPENIDLFKINKGDQLFQKSHEGLRYVLSKNQNKEDLKLVEQIFYPHNHIGDLPSVEDVDFENLPDDFDFEEYDKAVSSLIAYNPPEIVKAIAAFLDSISTLNFSNVFDYKELNQERIYPDNIWNDETDEDTGFNVRAMTEEFVYLRNFYNAAGNDGDYVLSYVG